MTRGRPGTSTSRAVRRATRAALVLASALLTSCEGADAVPVWSRLSGVLELLPCEERSGSFTMQEREVSFHLGRDFLSLSVPLRADEWRPAAGEQTWRTPLALNIYEKQERVRLHLDVPGVAVEWLKPSQIHSSRGRTAFAVCEGRLFLAGVGAEPPAEARLDLRLDLSLAAERRVEGANFSGTGVTLISGERAGARLAIPAHSRLSFGTALQPLVGDQSEPSVFRVRLDGRVLFEHRQEPVEHAAFAWHSVVLPDAPGERELVLEVEGPLAYSAFLDPVLGPAETGARGRRPWRAQPPDVIVFVADTFRADNLALYGGRKGLAPNLDALAAESLCFTHVWSTSTWTLPAHSSLFSGYYPPQMNMIGKSGKLPRGVSTLSERLAERGYRTGAVTEGGLVSARFGLDQGFGFFSERGREIEEMIAEAEAFLAAGDGRPTFLFMHSYRVHWPYRVSAATRARLGAELGIEGQAEDVLAQLLAAANAPGDRRFDTLHDLTEVAPSPRLLGLAKKLRAHYLGGVVDFDAAIGPFLSRLRASGYLDAGYLAFTSDHGEAFGEHGAFFHGHHPYEEQARIPLLLAGPGLRAGTDARASSLLDVTATVAALAGIAVPGDWPGRSVLEGGTGDERVLFGFEAMGGADDSAFLLVDQLKLHFREHPEPGAERLVRAFDLGRDGAEQHDLGAELSRPAEVLRRHERELLTTLTPLMAAEEANVDPDKAAELEALGY